MKDFGQNIESVPWKTFVIYMDRIEGFYELLKWNFINRLMNPSSLFLQLLNSLPSHTKVPEYKVTLSKKPVLFLELLSMIGLWPFRFGLSSSRSRKTYKWFFNNRIVSWHFGSPILRRVYRVKMCRHKNLSFIVRTLLCLNPCQFCYTVIVVLVESTM